MILLAVLSCGYVFANEKFSDGNLSKGELPILSGVGGDFVATGDNGERFQLSHYQGKVILLFFGYTNCADVCPFTLGYLKQVYEKLTPLEQEKVQIVFVTIDPEYDTAEHLQTFVRFFNKDFVGVTGNREKIDDIVALFQATYNKISGGEKVDTKNIRRTREKVVDDPAKDKGYLYGHTVNIYLMDEKGRTRSLDFTGTEIPVMLEKVRQLIAEITPVISSNEDEQQHSGTLESAGKNNQKQQLKSSKLPILLNYWVHLGPPNTRVMAAYGELVNTGKRDIVLTGISNSDFDKVELHETVIKNGVGAMIPQNDLVIKAGESLLFEPGKRHIMLITPLKAFKHNGQTMMRLHYRFVDNGETAEHALNFPVTLTGAGCAAMSAPL